MIRYCLRTASLVMLTGAIPTLAEPQTVSSPTVESRIASAIGKEVRITSMDGSERTGRLVSLSGSEVAFEADSRTQTVTLTGVSKVERTSRHVRWAMLLGTLGGGLVGSALVHACENRPGDDCGVNYFWGLGFGVGIGAGLGAVMNVATAKRHVIYPANQPTAAGVAPLLTPGGVGAALTVRW
jgi:hypothetical protein